MSELICGDVLAELRKLPAGTFHCAVTSPPYYGLRNYGVAGQVGLEAAPELWLAKMVAVFAEVRRVLRDDGVLWVNIGDSYSGDRGNISPAPDSKWPHAEADTPGNGKGGGPRGSAMLLPFRLALALQADGWTVRQDVVWAKPAPMPESVNGWRWTRCRVKVSPRDVGNMDGAKAVTEGTGWSPSHEGLSTALWRDCPGCAKCEPHGGYVLRRGAWRCTKSHEYILMLTKGMTYFCDAEAVKETSHWNGTRTSPKSQSTQSDAGGASAYRSGPSAVAHRNPRSVWRIGPEPLSEAHYAAYPTALPEKCIRASCSAKGCCPHCGAQWARVVETRPPEGSWHDHSNDAEAGAGQKTRGGRSLTGETLGWRPTCSCPAHEPVPCRVLDPFMGSGSTAIAAERCGQDWTGIELNPAYVEIARRRIAAACSLPLFDAVADARHVRPETSLSVVPEER